MADAKEEVNVGGKTFNMNTEIRVNLKTLLIFLGVVIPGITGLYYKLESSISASDEKHGKEIKAVQEDVSMIKEKMIVIGINVENQSKGQENLQKSVDKLIDKLIPETHPNSFVPVTNTNPERINLPNN